MSFNIRQFLIIPDDSALLVGNKIQKNTCNYSV